MLNELDVFNLSDYANINVVVKDGVYSDISESIVHEVQRLRDADVSAPDNSERIFQEAGIGKGESNQINALFRSDLRCWLTPDLCKKYNLVNIEILVKRLIKACSSLKIAHQLNGDYSIQLTLYVRHYLFLCFY